ncbi:hypothetical protein LUZ60_006966 [Juncus effusus]|nr:hypothetical protein LUZ60_006966 [Juncus effusus]
MACKLFAALVLLHFFLVLSSVATQKDVSKSIESENGDIFDCINIMSQPTFQDPSFMNHTIQVSPKDYGDNKVRFFMYWGNSQNRDCMDLLCSGFVQVSSDIPLGAQLKPVSVGALRVSWGGEAYGPWDEKSPSIGSGHFAYEGFGKAAVFMDATLVDENNNHFVPNPHDFYRQVERNVCYGVDNLGSGPNGIGFYFGGPGGCIDN